MWNSIPSTTSADSLHSTEKLLLTANPTFVILGAGGGAEERQMRRDKIIPVWFFTILMSNKCIRAQVISNGTKAVEFWL